MQIVNTTICMEKSICFLLVSTAATLAFFQIALEIGELFDCRFRFTYHKWTLYNKGKWELHRERFRSYKGIFFIF